MLRDPVSFYKTKRKPNRKINKEYLESLGYSFPEISKGWFEIIHPNGIKNYYIYTEIAVVNFMYITARWERQWRKTDVSQM